MEHEFLSVLDLVDIGLKIKFGDKPYTSLILPNIDLSQLTMIVISSEDPNEVEEHFEQNKEHLMKIVKHCSIDLKNS